MNVIVYAVVLVIQTYLMSKYNRATNEGKRTNAFLYMGLAFVTYILLATFRDISYSYIENKYVGGIDAYKTREIFNLCNNSFSSFLSIHGEIGYKLILWICHIINSDFKFFLFIIHSIAFVFYLKIVKRINYNKLDNYIYIFLLTTILYSMFNTIRNDLATLIWVNAFFMIKDNKMVKSISLMLFALGIHSSTVIGLLVVFIYFIVINSKFGIKTKIVLLILSLMISYLIAAKWIIPYIMLNSEYNVYLGVQLVAISIYLYGLYLLFVFIIKKREIVRMDNASLYLVVVVVFTSNFFLQLGFYMAYRFILLFLPIIYMITVELIEGPLKRNTIQNLILKIPMYFFLIYKIFDFFSSTLPSAGIVV